MMQETLIPKIGVVTDIRIDTPDIKTFRVVGLDGKKVFDHMPGQCAMLSIPGVGEARKKRLLQHFGTVTAVKNAALEQLSAVVPEAAARAAYEKFHG
mgnify:CR=1 FL=1